jgi:hypothetical protein
MRIEWGLLVLEDNLLKKTTEVPMELDRECSKGGVEAARGIVTPDLELFNESDGSQDDGEVLQSREIHPNAMLKSLHLI